MSMVNNVTAVKTNFSEVVSSDVQRSTFNRGSTLSTSLKASYITPVYLDEVLPGDTFKMDLRAVARLATPVFPTMDVPLGLDFYAFYCPNRLLFDGWEELNGENTTGAWVPSELPSPVPVCAPVSAGVVQSLSLDDYLGIPINTNLNDTKVNCLPQRMYYRVFNEWFRDENLQAPLTVKFDSTDGVGSGLYHYQRNSLLKACKLHDYFTSALPQPQKGQAPLIPIRITDLIPVITGDDQSIGASSNPALRFERENGSIVSDRILGTFNDFLVETSTASDANSGSPKLRPINLWADPSSLGQLSTTSISELRTQFQILKLLEKDSRGGTRYIELLKSHFGVEAGDYRLQRSEFLGKAHMDISLYQVPQSSSTDETSPLGSTGAFGHSALGTTSFFEKTFVEHGFLMVLAVARQVKTYQQGLERMWSRRERFDYYYPVLAHISEQPIYNREIFLDNSDSDNEVFGYQEAWADYRYKPSRVTGLMRSGVRNSLGVYNYSDYYTSRPYLSSGWIADNSDVNVDRTLAVSSDDSEYQLLLNIAFDLKSTRPMPVNSYPGLVDHF